MRELHFGRKYNNKANNGFVDINDPEMIAYLDEAIAAHDAFFANQLYAKFVSGERAGSIAKLELNPKYYTPDVPKIEQGYNYKGNCFRILNDRFHCIATWNGRRNKIQVAVPSEEIILLVGNNIETVWAKEDHSERHAELQKNPGQVDIHGQSLAVGDDIYYINARYGSRMTLTRGVIKEFKIIVNTSKTEITTIIESGGELSSLSYPESMVLKVTK